MNVSPSGLSVGGIPEGYSDCTPGGIRGTQGFNGKDLDISLGCHQASLVQLHPASVVEPGGTRKVPASVRDRLSPTREGKLQCKVCLYPHLEQGEGNDSPLQYSCLENPMDGGAWWAAVHGVAKSQARLSDFTFTFHFHALEKAMATHSRILAWRIPGTREPGGLLSLGSHRVRRD